MLRKAFFGVLILLTMAALAWAGVFYWKNLRGVTPALLAPDQDITQLLPESNSVVSSQSAEMNGENQTDFPLKLPEGFTISVFAKNLPLSRVMLFDSSGNMWLSRTRDGAITFLEIKDDQIVGQNDVFRNLKNPHGIVFDPENPSILYFAEEDKISRVPFYPDTKANLNQNSDNIESGGNKKSDFGVGVYTDATPEKIADLPFGAGHSTRTLLFGRDGRLYVSIGSSCNVCAENDNRRAKIFSMNKDGSDFREFASGLRNSVFLAIHPQTGKIWATEMGRDLLGDDIPPEEVNILEEGKNYGWPYCFSQNVHDDNFDPQKTVACTDKTPPLIEIQAHSAPLGLAFVPADSNWPEEYKNNLLVSYHGSWNRSEPTGYKIARYKLDEAGNVLAGQEDFITGWLQSSAGSAALGRPVDIVFYQGAMYVSDDKAGVIYKVAYSGK